MSDGSRRSRSGRIARAFVAAAGGRAARGLDRLIAMTGEARRITGFLVGAATFVPRDDDVYVVSYPRSGTTWMQFTLHLLRGRDDTDFAHISDVCPWYERSLAIGSATAQTFAGLPGPRVFKSHLPYGWLPPGRYVYMWRDGLDVALSYFHLYRSHLGYQGDFASFFQLFLQGRLQYRSWFQHVAGWRRHEGDRNVLVLRYEDVRGAPLDAVRRLSAFLDWPASEERLRAIVAQTSFEQMKAREAQFDHVTAVLRERGLQRGRFLREGQTGQGRAALTAEARAAFEALVRTARGTKLTSPDWRFLGDFLH